VRGVSRSDGPLHRQRAAVHDDVPDALAEVLIYNVLWFTLPIATLAICVVNPEAARRAVEALQDWISGHRRGLLTGVSFGAGAALVVRGVLAL
jgi:hypothetical protein